MEQKLIGTLSQTGEITCSLSGSSVQGEVTLSRSQPLYKGDYTVIPGDEPQTIACAGYAMSQNITVEAIPSNYGRIGWNGFTLSVS